MLRQYSKISSISIMMFHLNSPQIKREFWLFQYISLYWDEIIGEL